MRTLVTIDSGVNGGLAGIANGQIFTYGFTGKSQADIIGTFKIIRERAGKDECIAVLEALQYFSPQPAAKMAVYAESYGVLKGAIMTLGYRLVMVRAQAWQKYLGLFPVKYPKMNKDGTQATTKAGRPKFEKKDGEWKRTLKARAQELYPEHAATLQTADALLILEWSRRQNL